MKVLKSGGLSVLGKKCIWRDQHIWRFKMDQGYPTILWTNYEEKSKNAGTKSTPRIIHIKSCFWILILKGTRSSTNASEGGSSVAGKIKKTLALLDISGSKNSSMKEDDDTSRSGSYPLTPHEVRQSKINLYDNPYYSPSSVVATQEMAIEASIIEEQLSSLMKVVEVLSNNMKEQDAIFPS
ncbi:hypothetical protein RND71_034604 [Anisodus tanguticus]|uniref:Uncharacterized protein n=1 Tax=Anisodus tanguticus TaxID=243964 RepID=A0AAE1V562_9SOLA|nr:hypothetical protein RND71_034604 [Anisodus tanguticus]